MKNTSIASLPLTGTHLIEASAGTGKTHTITDLFLRFILEKGLTVDQVLIVTYTEAATEELRIRIRQRIRDAVKAFDGGGSSANQLLDTLVKRSPDPQSDRERLQHAVAHFDDAAIFTIHGFCRRLLNDYSYETGLLFDVELITSQDLLFRETVEDFWRKHFYSASKLFISYAIDKKFSPDYFMKLVSSYSHSSWVKIIPSPGPQSATEDDEQAFLQAFHEAASAWKTAKDEVHDILTTDASLNKNKYRKSSVASWLDALKEFFAGQPAFPLPAIALEKLTTRAITDSVKKNMAPPKHPFFDLCEKLSESVSRLAARYDRQLLCLQGALFQFVKEELDRKKEEQNVHYFDDLLVKVLAALRGKNGARFARSIRYKLKAALIDEFQDTDPIQYEIFKGIFDYKDSALFLIGDPKQAIYSFRSADVFTYMQAADFVNQPLSLDKNWRSEEKLIKAVNVLFSPKRHHNPFLYNGIKFKDIIPSGKPVPELSINGEQEPPFHLWFLEAGKEANGTSPLNKGNLRKQISEAVSNEIARLVNQGVQGTARIGSRSLAPGDIAVLVRKHSQARLIQKALSKRRIPCVLHSTGNLFESFEALELERILSAIASPRNERRVRAALATDIMGVSGDRIAEFMGDEPAWEKQIEVFREYHEIWMHHGLYRMFRQFMVQEKVGERLIAFHDGERRLTNLLHLSEVLHRQSTESNSGMHGLVKWLSTQIQIDTGQVEEYQLRLETDDEAVKIVTIHKSKGLEYPVVFCPFIWDDTRPDTKGVLFHDQKNNMLLTLDLGSEKKEIHEQYASEERLAENMRLLYVSLTRAINRCYLVWGGFKGAELSPLSYLFHNREQNGNAGIIQATKNKFKSLNDEDIYNDLFSYEALSGGSIAVNKLSDEDTVYAEHLSDHVAPILSSREVAGTISQAWSIESFSSLVSGWMLEQQFSEKDEFYESGMKPSEEKGHATGIFTLPPGPKTGTMLHDLLQYLDFTANNDVQMKQLVSEKLSEHGFEQVWLDTVCSMIRNVLDVPLDERNKDFTLSRIHNSARVNELEFYFPLKKFSKEVLQNIFLKYGNRNLHKDFPQLIGNLTFSTVKGFMKGFIDLVFHYNGQFYLVDWKSNLLGSDPENYRQENLMPVMQYDFYILQYHIYVLALDHYLAMRVPGYKYEKHFGGVYYIFLRGVNTDMGPGYGIYRDIPSRELIQEMSSKLLGE